MRISLFGRSSEPEPTRRPRDGDLGAPHREEATVDRCREDYAKGQQQRADAARAKEDGR